MRYLTVDEISKLNRRIIHLYSPGELIGIKDVNLLESAVLRPQSSVFGEDAYPDIYHKAAALFESLGQNHLFHNANKRISKAAMVMFLFVNGKKLTMTQPQAEDFTVNKRLSSRSGPDPIS